MRSIMKTYQLIIWFIQFPRDFRFFPNFTLFHNWFQVAQFRGKASLFEFASSDSNAYEAVEKCD